MPAAPSRYAAAMIQPTAAGLLNPTSLTMLGPKKVSTEFAHSDDAEENQRSAATAADP